MDFQPVLESDYVLLRALQNVDLEPLYQVAKDPMIWEQHHLSEEFKTRIRKILFRIN
ncbi:hypothetical protein MNBD_BACTEROID03-514 [hydrothermal vent metagenome]|uniref:Uncharacterized protein n=1 Tax=hydrothermal vent metagenome TaxID=652676 RepID=A0A3B0TCK6_9ZZZZ